MKNMTLALLATLSLTAPTAFAEDMKGMDHGKMAHEMKASEGDLFAPSRDAMHKGMDVTPTGNVDADFARNMIPHHEGAVAMARVELAHGKDPALRKMAADIIKAQETEIAFMQKWLKDHPTGK